MIAEATRQFVPERDFRRDGCTAACRVVRAIVPGQFGRTELLLHDAVSHEEYGRRLANQEQPEMVQTGGLVIDLSGAAILVYGERRNLFRYQWGVMSYLARRPGIVCSHDEILAAVWGPAYVGAHPNLRMVVLRIRDALGPCRELIESILGVGFRLRMDAPIDIWSEPPPLLRRRPWSRAFAACRGCGTTARRHFGHGYCLRCRDASGRRSAP